MFPSSIYKDRRNHLRRELGRGLALFPGNQEVSFNYPANTYRFRQDSNFLYFFGLDQPDLAGVMDLDSGIDILYGNDVDISDIIWMGKQPTLKQRGDEVGVQEVMSLGSLAMVIHDAIAQGRTIHYLPPYRGETSIQLSLLLGYPLDEIPRQVSDELIKGVVKLRMEKDKLEVQQIENMVDVAWQMHTTAMEMALPGIIERDIAGVIEGIALSQAHGVSFPIILTINGQTLHNHFHGNQLVKNRMLVVDAGCESEEHYASDITRTVPVGGIFTRQQADIYSIVHGANMAAIKAMKPGIPFKDIHLLAAREITKGLIALGLMKGDVEEAVQAGAHAMFFPHGLGHPLGLDVHDLEGLGENYVGYDNEVKRSKEFGLGFLRFGRKLKENFVMTIEPGIYFIPELIELWRGENRFSDFIDYAEVHKFRKFGGIRIEDDVLVTAKGQRVLGIPIPKAIDDIENIMAV